MFAKFQFSEQMNFRKKRWVYEKNKTMMIVYIILAILSISAFSHPDFFGSMGYSLAIDGIVAARGMCLVFALYSIGKAFSSFFED